ncbi:MAG: metallophosphoesterase [Proteobacteria bacterium]|nr:metallophosphoesterase [Pseudomonadota bacterium]
MLKKIVKILLFIALAYGVARFVVVFKDSRVTGQRAPYIQMQTPESVVIRWLTEDNQLGVVHFGEKPDLMSRIVLEGSASKNHTVKLSSLKPGTLYYYQVGDVGGAIAADPERNWFYTHPDKAVATRIWVIGDAGKAGETQDQVKDAALNWMRENPLEERAEIEGVESLFDVWLSLGDNAYRSGSNKQFQKALFEPYGDLLANKALWSVYGNHDARRWTYFRIFDFPEEAEAGGTASGTENYYSLDFSNVHFVMLDSQGSERDADDDMAGWLRSDLANNTKPWVVAVSHHPPYTKGSHDSDSTYDSRGRMVDMRENILPILEKAGVDLVLSGHSHMYERSYLLDCAYGASASFSQTNIVSTGQEGKNQRYLKPLAQKKHQGTVYMVAGSAAKVDRGDLNHPAHYVGLMEAGSVVIDVIDNKLVVRFINNEGEIRDEFSITKQEGYESGYGGCLK